MRLKTLNGAPLREHLDFSADTLLSSEQQPAALNDFHIEPSSGSVKWRHLAAKDTRLRSGWSQPYLPTGGLDHEDAPFSSAIPGDQISFLSSAEDVTEGNEFLEHSLIFHDTLVSSQIQLGPGGDSTVSSSSFLDDSFNVTLENLENQKTINQPGPAFYIPNNLEVTALSKVPTSMQLKALYPQTLTPSFLCVLTSKSDPREVLVRKGRYQMQLHEISVADETRAGFQITFWFRPTIRDRATKQGVQEVLRSTIEQAKVGDILLLRNIALSTFRDQVHGQSLNASIMRAKTTAHILLRSDGSTSPQQIEFPPALGQKLVRVKKWSDAHVVSDYSSTRKRKRNSRNKTGQEREVSDLRDDSLPPDTMED